MPRIEDFPRCDCGIHVRGRCDVDFAPGRGWGVERHRENAYRARLFRLANGYETPDLPWLEGWLKGRGEGDPEASVVTLSHDEEEVSVTDGKVSVTCRECGNEFQASRVTAKFCSASCRVKSSRG